MRFFTPILMNNYRFCRYFHSVAINYCCMNIYTHWVINGLILFILFEWNWRKILQLHKIHIIWYIILCYKLNGILTDWFPVLSGVRQGDSSSSTIFAFYINDLIDGLKTVNKGIRFNEHTLCSLTYADDVLILTEYENDMQGLLNFVYEWCRKWRLKINFSKTNVMHCRNKGRMCSNFEFKIGSEAIEYTSLYRYLGVHINENLDFTTTAETLSKAGGRPLVQLSQRSKVIKMVVLKHIVNCFRHALYLL